MGVPNFTMLYSGTDERVQVTVGSTPRRFVYDEDGRLIGEYGTGPTDIKAEHVWLMPAVDEGGYEPLALIGPTTTTWVTGDHLGKPVLLTKSNSLQANLFDATPFGTRWKQYAASPTTAMAFPGQIIDVADRFYNKYRDYDPSLGRYLQADPIGLEGGDNVYGYAAGNPVRWTDAYGLDVWIEGPSAQEPTFHQSINVGNPFGTYRSYSFGMDGRGVEGSVYRDTSHGGLIEKYKKTSPEQDRLFEDILEHRVGDTGIYGVDDICRSWSQRQFAAAPGREVPPPLVRRVVPQISQTPWLPRSITGGASSSGTGTSK